MYGHYRKKQLFRSVEIVLFNSRTTRVQDKTAHVSSRIAQLHGKPRSSHQKIARIQGKSAQASQKTAQVKKKSAQINQYPLNTRINRICSIETGHGINFPCPVSIFLNYLIQCIAACASYHGTE